MKRISGVVVIIMLLIASINNTIYAQCAMCRASATSSMNNKDKSANAKHVGAGLNTGIIYLMCVPYIIGGIGAFVYWRNRKVIKAFLDGEAV